MNFKLTTLVTLSALCTSVITMASSSEDDNQRAESPFMSQFHVDSADSLSSSPEEERDDSLFQSEHPNVTTARNGARDTGNLSFSLPPSLIVSGKSNKGDTKDDLSVLGSSLYGSSPIISKPSLSSSARKSPAKEISFEAGDLHELEFSEWQKIYEEYKIRMDEAPNHKEKSAILFELIKRSGPKPLNNEIK